MQWRKMDDCAPLDETKVLLVVRFINGGDRRDRVVIGWYSPSLRRWVHGAELGPFYWMPLPELPIEQSSPGTRPMISNMATG